MCKSHAASGKQVVVNVEPEISKFDRHKAKKKEKKARKKLSLAKEKEKCGVGCNSCVLHTNITAAMCTPVVTVPVVAKRKVVSSAAKQLTTRVVHWRDETATAVSGGSCELPPTIAEYYEPPPLIEYGFVNPFWHPDDDPRLWTMTPTPREPPQEPTPSVPRPSRSGPRR